MTDLRRLRGFGVNPWATGSRFTISHRLLTDETYLSGLRDILGAFRPRALLVLDEAHHAAPASGSRYAVDSQFTRAVREVAQWFEHRLFLTATPHNGHSNNFSSLLEMLDPQRFTRGVPVRPSDLEPIAVGRLKEDLRQLGESFSRRIVEPIVLSRLPGDAPELALARMLSEYEDLRERRLSKLAQRGGPRAPDSWRSLRQASYPQLSYTTNRGATLVEDLAREKKRCQRPALSARPELRFLGAGARIPRDRRSLLDNASRLTSR